MRRQRASLIFRAGTSITLNRVLRNQLRFLREDGWRVCCVCDDDEWAVELRRLGLEHRPIGMGRRPSPVEVLAWGLRFYWLCRRERPDVVHTHNAFHGIAGRLAARIAGVPVIVQTVHNWYYLEPPASPRARIFRFLERVAAHFCDGVLFINRDDYERAVRERIMRPEKRYYIGNGIDVGRFEVELAAVDPAEARSRFGLTDDDAVLSMVARLEPPKDHDMLLSALPAVVESIPELRVLLAGHGLLTDAVRARVAELGLADRVKILGHRDDVAAILRASDAHVLTSSYEGFGRCLVEAMVAGVPVVGTDVVGIRDVIHPNETGLLVQHGDIAGLSQALVTVLNEDAGQSELARRARVAAVETFDERLPAKRVAEIYAELLDRRTASGGG